MICNHQNSTNTCSFLKSRTEKSLLRIIFMVDIVDLRGLLQNCHFKMFDKKFTDHTHNFLQYTILILIYDFVGYIHRLVIHLRLKISTKNLTKFLHNKILTSNLRLVKIWIFFWLEYNIS